jgi:hypothetical protein
MRRVLLPCLLLSFALAMAAGGKHISARAGFSIPHTDEIGSASVIMDITGAKGTFQYAAEDHEAELLCSTECVAPLYPHVIIKATQILTTKFKGKSFTMTAKADFQGEPVKIEVTAYDGGRGLRSDTFEIRCTDANGALVYQRSGKIETGDIAID